MSEYKGQQITMYLTETVYDLDPAHAYMNESSRTIVSLLFDTLYVLDEKGEVKPSLAKEYTIKEDPNADEYYMKSAAGYYVYCTRYATDPVMADLTNKSGITVKQYEDIQKYQQRSLREQIGLVQQDVFLFAGTIYDNIVYGRPDATEEEVVAACKAASIHDFIVSQPEGYARNVGEKGFALSGGERQRIAIARAILRNPPVLILDEATSALDTVTEKLVQNALANLMTNRTTLAIAHRLSTIVNANLILVMDQGKIVERGTHQELYEAGGVYRKLCDMQNRE